MEHIIYSNALDGEPYNSFIGDQLVGGERSGMSAQKDDREAGHR